MFESILSFIFVITPLVFFHELGHFAFARMSGVQVLAFSVGFGREIIGFTDKQGTRWRLSLIPMGGYVKMFGENSPDSEEGTFASANLFQRMCIVAAGPLANVVLAIMLLAFVNLYYGTYMPKDYYEFGIGSVAEDSAAAQINMQQGDLITHLNNTEISDFQDIIHFMDISKGEPVVIRYQRDGASYRSMITPKPIADENGNQRFVLGVSNPGLHRQQLGFIDSFSMASQQTYVLFTRIMSSLGGLISGALDYRDLGGPIKIAQYSGETFSAGAENFIFFAALLSLNLALINLFPIPGLDGGHMAMFILEAIFRRPPPQNVVNILNAIGIVFLLTLLVVVSVKDIFEIFQ